ncbi:hypothetical protein BLNAU_22139 [Blattamonas nauphoetae]|uniref:Uncharacterized protein n=1 Tax=Blattamonas nauphoetae TaxID=2049346 RepID=A0ABQ9WUC6_9EUKA|nr:hypothetical protein BLNAU_22139 [Blattamonas nauphoetae]
MQSVRHPIPTFISCFYSLHSHWLFFSPHPHPRHSEETQVFLSHLTHTQLFTTLADTLRQSAVEMIFVSRHLISHHHLPFVRPLSSRSLSLVSSFEEERITAPFNLFRCS